MIQSAIECGFCDLVLYERRSVNGGSLARDADFDEPRGMPRLLARNGSRALLYFCHEVCLSYWFVQRSRLPRTAWKWLHKRKSIGV